MINSSSKAQDLILLGLEDAHDIDVTFEVYAKAIWARLRDSGLLLDWKTDMENAPKDKPVFLYDKRDGTHVSAEWDSGNLGYPWLTLDGSCYPSSAFTHYAIISTEGVE